MKILLAFAVVVAATYAADYTQETVSKQFKDKVVKELQKCKAKFPNINDADYKKLITRKKMPTTEDEECFALCFAKERGYYNRPGKMNLAKMKARNSKKYKQPENLKAANKIDEICVKKVQKETNDCKTAAKFFICRVKQAKANGFKLAKYSSK